MWQRRRNLAVTYSVLMLLDNTHGNVMGGLRLSTVPGTVEETNGEPVAVETDDGETETAETEPTRVGEDS
jgi:hypothetical protein